MSVLVVLKLPCRHFRLHEMVLADSEKSVKLYSRKESCNLAAVGCVEGALREQLAQGPINNL